MRTPHMGGQRGGERGIPRWIALGLHVAVGFFPYGASGLLAPPVGVVVLFALWAGLLVVLLRWRPARRWLLLAVPVAALAVWFAVVSAGDAWFGWTA